MGVKSLIVAGGNDEAEEGIWVWPSDGQRFYSVIERITERKNEEDDFPERITERIPIAGQYHNWQDDRAPTYRGGNCMVMVSGSGNWGVGPAGKWKEVDCSVKKTVVCEAPVVEGEAVYLHPLPPLN